MRILLVRLRLIGDVVCTTPAIRALRDRFPDAHLTYVVEPAAAPIVEGNPHLNEVIVAPRGRGLAHARGELSLLARLRRNRYDLAIDFHGGPRSSLMVWASRAPQRIGYEVAGRAWMYTQRIGRPRTLRPRHSVENQWDLLAPLGIAPPDPAQYPVEMAVDPSAAARIADRLAHENVTGDHEIVVVHVSASSPFRRWPIDSFIAAIAHVASAHDRRRVIVTAGPSEPDAVRTVVEGARTRLGAMAGRVLQCGDFPLADLRALLDRAALFIGGDSGPLHIAATTAIPIVGLYGPTLPVRSGPWRSPSLVTEAVDVGELPCRPCDQRVCEPGDFRCLTGITPDAVAAAAARALGSQHTHTRLVVHG